MIGVVVTLFTGCKDNASQESSSAQVQGAAYEQITPEEAKRIMDTEIGYVIIDSRTQGEFDEGHINGAVMIPEYEINACVEEKIPDKNTLVLVYCRSGRRSKIAAQALVDLGYTNVKEFGGIIDWPYDIVK